MRRNYYRKLSASKYNHAKNVGLIEILAYPNIVFWPARVCIEILYRRVSVELYKSTIHSFLLTTRTYQTCKIWRLIYFGKFVLSWNKRYHIPKIILLLGLFWPHLEFWMIIIFPTPTFTRQCCGLFNGHTLKNRNRRI